MTVSVVTDSVASIPAEDARLPAIEVVSLYVSDGETNQRELDMDVASFYERIADMSRTSHVFAAVRRRVRRARFAGRSSAAPRCSASSSRAR